MHGMGLFLCIKFVMYALLSEKISCRDIRVTLGKLQGWNCGKNPWGMHLNSGL